VDLPFIAGEYSITDMGSHIRLAAAAIL